MHRLSPAIRRFALTLGALGVLGSVAAFSACDVSDPGDPDDEQEVITTVTLRFTPVGGGETLVFSSADPENDGAPVVDDVLLLAGSYTLTVAFLNELEDPAEDITAEVADESEEHQILIYGDAVAGPASDVDDAILTHSYDDEDENGLPIGLENTIVAAIPDGSPRPTSGTLKVMLRHLPEQSGAAQKTESIAADFVAGNVIAGDVDANVTFPLIVD